MAWKIKCYTASKNLINCNIWSQTCKDHHAVIVVVLDQLGMNIHLTKMPDHANSFFRHYTTTIELIKYILDAWKIK